MGALCRLRSARSILLLLPSSGWILRYCAVQDAANSAAADGVTLLITSGWRSRAFQQQLLDDAVQTYGSLAVARQWVATPDESHHVSGKAVDIGPAAAYGWMLAHSTQFGLCQVFANEKWHYELTADAEGQCPPLRTNAAG
ncbi:Putative VanY-type carboxypeptidase [Mycobacteroides abscessus subsp. abscessus]|nr:Putative VanY-type carboxypeptidase [Mycobacteroides abscessus subsp. abscessus]SLF04264.1 Putative VanY-type carboxypeptidase [Mycobacteroides abscessus subsp. abscessus]SLF79054.1 Putative VanY-type carboxypeptidase [Mycobacteroides abscessus subsp. abscessus]SLH41911.1 Putative VanY-type carboxypeptidase [Mycobacteroides abscessus subsp. abscessus]